MVQTTYWRDDLRLWTHSLAVTGSNFNVEVALADALNHAGRLDEAVEHYRRGLDWGVNLKVNNNLGIALARLGKLDEAIPYFYRAIELDPRSGGSHANLGEALSFRGHLDEAIQQYLDAIELDPSAGLWHFKVAGLLTREGRLDEAITHFQQALQLDPTQAVAHARIGGGACAARADRRRDRALSPCARISAQRHTTPPGARSVARGSTVRGDAAEAGELGGSCAVFYYETPDPACRLGRGHP